MQKTISTSRGAVSYNVRQSARARHVRIAVSCDGSVVVTHPTTVSFERVDSFVAQKISWILKKVSLFSSRGFTSIPAVRGEYGKRKEEVRRLVCARIEHFNTFYGFRIGRVAIRSQKTRWGSCSKKGNLNFNYRIIHLAPELVDYVVVHELCHLAELNHSKNFWSLVSKTLPHYMTLKKGLTKVIHAP